MVAARQDLTLVTAARMSARYARVASTQNRTIPLLAPSAVLDATLGDRALNHVMVFAGQASSPHFLAQLQVKIVRSALKGPSSSRAACPFATCALLAALPTERGLRRANCAITTPTVVVQGHSTAVLVMKARWLSPRAVSSASSPCFAALASTAKMALPLATHVLQERGV